MNINTRTLALWAFILGAPPSFAQCLDGAPVGYPLNEQVSIHVIDPDCSFDPQWRKLLADPSVEGVGLIYHQVSSTAALNLLKANPSLGQALSVWSLDGKAAKKAVVTNASDVAGDFSAYVLAMEDDSCSVPRVGSVVTDADGVVVSGLVRKILPGPKCVVHVVKPNSLRQLQSVQAPQGAHLARTVVVGPGIRLVKLDTGSRPFVEQHRSVEERNEAGEGPAYAKVAVYRYGQYAGKAIRPSIVIDGKDIARIQSGKYILLAVKPGKHVFASSDSQSQVELDLAPGTEYFIRIEIATGFWKGHGRIVLVMKEQGLAELKKMQPADRPMIKDDTLLYPGFQPAK